jgi:hypothetical protein
MLMVAHQFVALRLPKPSNDLLALLPHNFTVTDDDILRELDRKLEVPIALRLLGPLSLDSGRFDLSFLN